MTIGVIIPTYKRPEMLLRAVRSLQEQTLPECEILVVDNATDPEVERMLMEFNRTAKLPARYLPEPKLGLHHARHAGARLAESEVLVFSDDDATFDPGWLQAYVKAFAKHATMAAAGGPVRPLWEAAPPQWLLQYMGDAPIFAILSLMEPYREFYLDSKGFFFGVNMAIRRNILFKVGGFNPDAFGDKWLGDGETGLNRKLWEQRMLIGYVPEAIVYHHIPLQRMSIEYLCHRMANEGACDIYARYHHAVPHWLSLFKYATSIAIKNSMFWAGARVLKNRQDLFSLRIQLRAARTRSQLKYLIRLMRDKEFQRLVLKADWLSELCA